MSEQENRRDPVGEAAMIDAVLRKEKNWQDLWFYQKTVALYKLTYVFTHRFLPRYGDRTVDQMVQAARSGKQNIVEGMADGVTSMELELKLLNVARASIKELREDYEDYLLSRSLSRWRKGHPRYDGLVEYCRAHNSIEQYEPFFTRWTDEEMANAALSLCHFVDKMMKSYEQWIEADFKENGGIRERMTAARLGYRNIQRALLDQKDREIVRLNDRIRQLERELELLRSGQPGGQGG